MNYGQEIIDIIRKKSTKDNELLFNPWGLVIDTTLLCNNSCSFCWRANFPEYLKKANQKYKIKTMPFETYKKIIDDACQYDSINWLSLCGPMGEPLLNDRIEDFFEYACNKHHFNRISINTNGLVIDKRDIGRLLNSITEFSISVDSIQPKTYEKIHGHGNLEKVIDNIRKCVEYKKQNGSLADIWVRFTESKHNVGQISEFIEFFKELGVDYILYLHEHSFAGVNKSLNSLSTVHDCTQPYQIINFNFLGEMTTCCVNWHFDPVFGNINDKTIKQTWESAKKRIWNLKSKSMFLPKPCNNCSGLGDKVAQSTIINCKEDNIKEGNP